MPRDLHCTIDHLISSLSNRREPRISILSAARQVVSRSFPFLSDTHLSNRLLSLLSKLDCIEDAQKLFDQIPHRDICSFNTLIFAYSNAGQIDNARDLFDRMPQRDHFSWSAIISTYTQNRNASEVLSLYRQMFQIAYPGEICKVDNRFTASSALAAATDIMGINYGKEIHGHVIRSGFQSDKVVWSALTDMYAKCGYMHYAKHVFDLAPDKDFFLMDNYDGKVLQ
jgi:pentatricopeptide repeat protein